MSQFNLPPHSTPTLTPEESKFLQEGISNLRRQNTPGDNQSQVSVINQAFLGHFGRYPPPGTIEGILTQPVPGGDPTWNAPYPHQNNSGPQFGHFTAPQSYSGSLINHSYDISPFMLQPNSMNEFAPSSSQAHATMQSMPANIMQPVEQRLVCQHDETPKPSARYAPADKEVPAKQALVRQRDKTPKLSAPYASSDEEVPAKQALVRRRGKTPKPSARYASADEGVQSHGTAVRRKNIYLPNNKSAKTLWSKRKVHDDLIRCAIKDSNNAIKEVVDKVYTESSYESLSKSDQALWAEISELAQRVEASFVLVPPKARKEKMRQEFAILHGDTLGAFGVVPMTINFMPKYGTVPAFADFLTIKPFDRKTFNVWLEKKHPKAYEQLLGSLMGYCNYLWEGSTKEAKEDDTLPDTEENQSGNDNDEDDVNNEDDINNEDDESLPPVTEVRDGLRIFADLDQGGNVHRNRKIYRACFLDRFRLCGYKGRKVDWARVKRERAEMIVEDDVPEGKDGTAVSLGAANLLSKAELDVWIPFFHKHQEGVIPFERGLIFKPTAFVAAAEAFTDKTDEDAPPPEQQPAAPAPANASPTPANTAPDAPNNAEQQHQEGDPYYDHPANTANAASPITTSGKAAPAPITTTANAAPAPANATPANVAPPTTTHTTTRITRANAAPTATTATAATDTLKPATTTTTTTIAANATPANIAPPTTTTHTTRTNAAPAATTAVRQKNAKKKRNVTPPAPIDNPSEDEEDEGPIIKQEGQEVTAEALGKLYAWSRAWGEEELAEFNAGEIAAGRPPVAPEQYAEDPFTQAVNVLAADAAHKAKKKAEVSLPEESELSEVPVAATKGGKKGKQAVKKAAGQQSTTEDAPMRRSTRTNKRKADDGEAGADTRVEPNVASKRRRGA